VIFDFRYKDLLVELTKKEIKIRYKNSYLGYLWSLANPLAMALIFYFIFQIITKVQMEHYALFLITGLFVWQWIVNGMSVGTMLFVGNAGLIKKVNFPRYFLGIALVFSEGFNFFFSIPIIIGFMLYYGITPSPILLLGVPLLFTITGLFIYGLAILLATVNLFFRDLERLIGLIMTFMMYATPILFPLEMVPDAMRNVVALNPFTPFVMMWRELFLHAELSWYFIGLALLYAFIATTIGMLVYNKLKFKFAELV
jgi:lipopolysaccharide transport system permease protein